MSHFTVAVVTDALDEGVLTKALAPYHEFECTGRNDEYVQDIDKTDELREHLNDKVWVQDPPQRSKAKVSRNGDPEIDEEGSIEYRIHWGDRENRDFTGWVEIPRWKLNLLNGENPLVEALEYFGVEDKIVTSLDQVKKGEGDADAPHKYGYVLWPGYAEVQNAEKRSVDLGPIDLNAGNDADMVLPDGFVYIDRTNPNRKWDWWQLGGRWNGMLIVKDPSPENSMTGERSWASGDRAVPRSFDFARIGDLDIEAMQAQEKIDAASAWDEAWSKYPRTMVTDENPENETFGQQIDKGRRLRSLMYSIEDAENTPEAREAYIAKRGNGYGPIRTFACLDETGWHERGHMGWFAMVSDEKEDWNSIWDAWFEKLRAEHPNKFLAIVDCHI